jgi:hypothetical protein
MRLQVASVAEVDRLEFLASFVESKHLKIGSSMVEPGHALGGGAPCACRNNHLERAEVAAAVGFLTAVVEPENAERENPVDHGGRLGLADSDYSFGGSAAQQASANVCRAEAVFEVHGRTQAVHLGAYEAARENTV